MNFSTWLIIGILWIGFGSVILAIEINADGLEAVIKNKKRPEHSLLTKILSVLVWPITILM